jgi:hypothetical protein
MEEDIYKTRDLAEAAVLLIKKRYLLTIERYGKTCVFVFAGKNESARLGQQFYFGNVIVNARDYYEAITRLKKRIFASH